MAQIRSFVDSTQAVKAHPTEVDCQHRVISSGGIRLLHLSTFGSDERASSPKSSQSIQLDSARAGELIDIIKAAFPELRTR